MDGTVSAQATKEEGIRLFREGLYDEAAARFQQARDEFEAQGNEIEAAEMVNNIGLVRRLEGKWNESEDALQQALDVFTQQGDRSRQAQALGNLGGLYASQGQRDKAKEYLSHAAEIFGELKDTQRQGETLLALGAQLWKTGDRGGGLSTYESGLQSLDKPSISQKALRRLLSFRNRLLGGGRNDA